MKIALITAGLLATALSQASSALARGGPLHLWAPSSSEQVKPDVGAQPACKVHNRHRSGSAQKRHILSACPQGRTLLLRAAVRLMA
jgi:hypothetical protein